MATQQETTNQMKTVGMIADGQLSVSLLTPERVLFEGPADSVVVPGHDGEFGIRGQHVTMVARLGAGISRITCKGETTRTFVSGGFVQVAGNVVTILTDEAGDPAAIDRTKAQELLTAVLAEEAKGDEALADKERRLNLARVRVRTANEAASS